MVEQGHEGIWQGGSRPVSRIVAGPGARLVLVRHGESEANVADFINDDPARPVHLTSRGVEQTRAAARNFAGRPFARAFASEFPRAIETARILLAGRDCPLQVDARLNERRSGMDGLPTATFNDFVRADPVHATPPGGESFVDVVERLRAFLDAQRACGDAWVLAVSHENPILAALAVAGVPAEVVVRRKLANCAAVILAAEVGGWRVLDAG